MPRTKLPDTTPEIEPAEGGGRYFDELPTPTEFVRSGCTLLDEVLGGGWALGRISSIYGDSATGKSMLGIEACANCALQFPDAKIFYRERESAFDFSYAENIGFPTSRVDFKGYNDGLDTIEDLFDDLTSCAKLLTKEEAPGFYCVDSLDAFSDEGEQENKDIRDSSGVAKKARILSQLFRQRVGDIAKSRMHLMFISQVRAKIGVTMGRKTEMSGGFAIRFYSSQRIFLRQIEMMSPEVKGVKRPIGIWVRATNEKSRMGMPYRDAEFPILFGYGIDNISACVEWLRTVGELSKLGLQRGAKEADAKKWISETNGLGDEEYNQRVKLLNRATHEVWHEVEELTRQRHVPIRKKYENG